MYLSPTQEHITLAAEEISELNRWKAAAVRAEGWTADVAEHYNMIEMYQVSRFFRFPQVPHPTRSKHNLESHTVLSELPP